MRGEGKGGVKGGGQRLRTAKGRTASSTRWLARQLADPYVKKARAEGYRSRAAYKLAELDDKFGLLKGVDRVIDLGIAPGGWSQVVRQRCPRATVVGIDLLPTDPIPGVTIFEMDFISSSLRARNSWRSGFMLDAISSSANASSSCSMLIRQAARK